jgi:hypothetical protein
MATLVARPDADPETSTFDGDVQYIDVGDTTWATMRGAATATNMQDDAATLQNVLFNGNAAGSWSTLGRIIVGFATAGIPDDATITATTLQLRTTADAIVDDLTQSLNICTITAPASATAITDTDYAVAKYGSTKLCDADRALAGMAISTDYVFTLNATGIAAISKTGITWLSCRFVSDITNTEAASPGAFASSQVTFNSAEAATEAHRPVLTVTYTPAAAGSSPGCITAIFPAIRRRRDL